MIKKRRPKSTPSKKPAASTRQADTWQAKKSQRTRTTILEATLKCFVDVGYSRTTIDGIAKNTGATVGALMHHFDSRAEIIKAAANYVAEKRAEEFEQIVAELGTQPMSVEGMHHLVARLAQYYSMPSFVALHELLVAARTDKELEDILLPLQRTLDQRIAEIMRAQFPYLEKIEDTREVLQDVWHFALRGLAVSPEPYLSSSRLKKLWDFLGDMALRELAVSVQRLPPAQRPSIPEWAEVRSSTLKQPAP